MHLSPIYRLISLMVVFHLLAPGAIKTVHDFHHLSDVVCHEQNVKHYHQLEHHCNLCDFNLPVLGDGTILIWHTHLQVISAGVILAGTEFLSSEIKSLFSPRAPPVNFV